MLKKYIRFSVIFVTLFLYIITEINAYEFKNPENEGLVNDLINEIYDSREQYLDLAGTEEEMDFTNASNNLFWWPIGSVETEEKNGVLYASGAPAVLSISSYYGGYDNFRESPHSGIDIPSEGNGVGVVNIIAAKSGEVVYPVSLNQTQYEDNGYYGNLDAGGSGNYVKIKHSDGTYTVYAHLAKNSITVMSGDVVAQGQVIGKMGNSGSSTGAHLHFEVRVGFDSKENSHDPLDEYVDPKNPRPMSYGGDGFSLVGTSLTKEEFYARMIDYYERTGNEGFYNNFVLNSDEIYNTSLENDINPELVVVTAGTEQSWTLSSACKYTNNYWGIGITNGNGCNSGGKYNSLSEGIAAYASTLSAYNEYGSYASTIKNRYEQRLNSGCDSSGHGMPGTLVGMQSVYSYVGDYRYNPGNAGLGGCYYLNILYGGNYCSEVATCSEKGNCSEDSRTTVCEQNDYTAWQVKNKIQLRYDIFGL